MTANQLKPSCLMEFGEKLICCSTEMIQYIHVSEALYTNLLINSPAKNSPVPLSYPWCGIVDQVIRQEKEGAETISGRRFGINLFPEFEMAPIISAILIIVSISRHYLARIILRRFHFV